MLADHDRITYAKGDTFFASYTQRFSATASYSGVGGQLLSTYIDRLPSHRC